MQQQHCGPDPAPPERDAVPPSGDEGVVFGDPFSGPGHARRPGHRSSSVGIVVAVLVGAYPFANLVSVQVGV